jgi:hypothetical protein
MRIQSYFTDQNPMSQNALLTALREKYGKETLTNAVTAMLHRRGPELLQGYNVELVNLPYALKAATATGNANNAAAEQSRRNQTEKADQNEPKF